MCTFIDSASQGNVDSDGNHIVCSTGSKLKLKGVNSKVSTAEEIKMGIVVPLDDSGKHTICPVGPCMHLA